MLSHKVSSSYISANTDQVYKVQALNLPAYRTELLAIDLDILGRTGDKRVNDSVPPSPIKKLHPEGHQGMSRCAHWYPSTLHSTALKAK